MRLFLVFMLLLLVIPQQIFASNEDSLLFPSDFDDQLDEYYVAADLSSKTKDESLGNLFLYTADDLDKMLATKLSDVVEQVPLFTINQNGIGENYINLLGMTGVITLRLFIDEQEVSNPITGDALAVWADLPLDFVSHIEVYIASAAFDLNTEPAIMIVRVYSKAPERQQGGIVSQSVDSEGGYSTSAYYANVTGKHYYSLFASSTDSSVGDMTFQETGFNTEEENKYILGSYSYNKKFDFQFGYTKHDSDLSWDDLVGSQPDSSQIKYEQAYISAKLHLLDNRSLIAYTGYNKLFDHDQAETWSIGAINTPGFPEDTVGYNRNYTLDRFNIGVEKVFETATNKLSTIFEYERTSFERVATFYTQNTTLTTKQSPNYTPYDQYDKYILKLEDSYNISKNYLLSASARNDLVKTNNDSDDFNQLSYKVGLIANPIDPLVLKFFYMHSSTILPLMVIARSSEDMENTELDTVTAELTYEYENSIFRVSAAEATVKGGYTTDENFKYYINYDGEEKYRFLVLGVEHTFTNKIGIAVDVSKAFDPAPFSTSPDLMINARGTYSYENWMFYANASYSPAYTSESSVEECPNIKVDDTLDIDLGIRYKFTENLSLDLKAYNILGKAAEVPFWGIDYTNGTYLTDTIATQETKVEAILRWKF